MTLPGLHLHAVLPTLLLSLAVQTSETNSRATLFHSVGAKTLLLWWLKKIPPGLPGGGGCLIATGDLAVGNCWRIYTSLKCGPCNNHRGMVFEVYALVNFC